MNKHNLGGKNIFNHETGQSLGETNFLRGVVISNYDPSDGRRIKVRVKGVDDKLSDKELPFTSPMLPIVFNITPKKGEVVFVFVPSMKNAFTDRMYLGPLISQPQKLFKDTFIMGSTSGLDTGFTQLGEAPSTIPENRGVYPDKEDVAVQGRDNSDLIFKSKEVLMRAGQYEFNTEIGAVPKFNLTTPSYIQVKNDVVVSESGSENIEKGGIVNVVSNKINLLTHKGGSPRFILNDQDSMISSIEMEKILREAHPMVFGDTLVAYLKLQRNAFVNHVHAYHGMNAEDLSGRNDIEDYLSFDLDSLLSKNIKLN